MPAALYAAAAPGLLCADFDRLEGEHLDRHTRLTGRYSRALGDVRKCHPDSQEGGETVAVGA